MENLNSFKGFKAFKVLKISLKKLKEIKEIVSLKKADINYIINTIKENIVIGLAYET